MFTTSTHFHCTFSAQRGSFEGSLTKIDVNELCCVLVYQNVLNMAVSQTYNVADWRREEEN